MYSAGSINLLIHLTAQVWEGATAAEVGERVAGFLEKKAVGKAIVLLEAAKP